MTKKHETTPSFHSMLGKVFFEKILSKSFTGVFTLNDTKARGVKDVIVIVIDEKNQKHILTTAGPTKEECLSDGSIRYAYDVRSSGETTERGNRLPGKRNSEDEEVDYGGCKWIVHSAQNEAGEWIEKSRFCLGYDNASPPCPLYTTVESD